MKNSLFDSLFSSESCVFHHYFFPPLKKCLLWLYIVKKRGLGQHQNNVGFIPNKVLMQKSFPYIVFTILAAYACSCMSVYVISMCMHNLSVRTHACVCVHTFRVSCSLSFLK